MSRVPLFALVLLASQGVSATPLPEDRRLGNSALELQAIVDGAARTGLPDGLLVDKVREGLAKGVPAPRITAAVQQLARSLEEARGLAVARYKVAPPSLLRAIAEARSAGASAADVNLVLAAASRDAAHANRAVDALVDLLARRFPPTPSARAVANAVTRAPAGDLERIGANASRRKQDGASDEVALADAVRALESESSNSNSNSNANSGALRGRDGERGPNRETSGQRGPNPHSHGPKK